MHVENPFHSLYSHSSTSADGARGSRGGGQEQERLGVVVRTSPPLGAYAEDVLRVNVMHKYRHIGEFLQCINVS